MPDRRKTGETFAQKLAAELQQQDYLRERERREQRAQPPQRYEEIDVYFLYNPKVNGGHQPNYRDV